MKKQIKKVSVWLCVLTLILPSVSVVKAVGVNGLTGDIRPVAPTTPSEYQTPHLEPSTSTKDTTVIKVTKVNSANRGEASGNASRETTTAVETTTVAEATVTTSEQKVNKPNKVTVKKKITKKKSSKELRFTFKKVNNTKGYQVAVYTSKKNAKKNKNAIVKKFIKNTKVKVISKKLKNRKTLFVKVRAYKLNGKAKVYGNWSKAVKVTIKK